MNCVKRDGFTLIEIMVVVVIIGLLVATIGPGIMERLGKGRKGAAKSMMSNIKGALMQYNMDIGRFPSTKEGLNGLIENVGKSSKWQGPYKMTNDLEVPRDSWERDFVYNAPPQILGKKKGYKYFELISYGENGEGSPEEQWLVIGE